MHLTSRTQFVLLRGSAVLLAMSLLVAAYTRGDAVVVAPMQYSQIIWATLYGALLFEEYPEWRTFIGIAVIVVSGIYIVKREASGSASRNTPVLHTRTRIGQSIALRVGWWIWHRGRKDR